MDNCRENEKGLVRVAWEIQGAYCLCAHKRLRMPNIATRPSVVPLVSDVVLEITKWDQFNVFVEIHLSHSLLHSFTHHVRAGFINSTTSSAGTVSRPQRRGEKESQRMAGRVPT